MNRRNCLLICPYVGQLPGFSRPQVVFAILFINNDLQEDCDVNPFGIGNAYLLCETRNESWGVNHVGETHADR